MSFFYNQYVSGKPSENQSTNKKKFFAHAIETHKQDLPQQNIPNISVKKPSKEAFTIFIQKVRSKISQTNNISNTLKLLVERCEQLSVGIAKYPEITSSNFINEQLLNSFLNDFNKAYSFLENRVYQYKIERFISAFWIDFFNQFMRAIELFFNLLQKAFENPVAGSKLSFFVWLPVQKTKGEIETMLGSMFTKSIVFMEKMERLQEHKPLSKLQSLVQQTIEFSVFLAAEFEVPPPPSQEGFLGFLKLTVMQPVLNTFTESIFNYIVSTLEFSQRAYTSPVEKMKIAKASQQLFFKLLKSKKSDYFNKDLVKLARIFFSMENLESIFKSIIEQKDFDMSVFLNCFKNILISPHESDVNVPFFTSLFLFLVWLYKNDSYLVMKFPNLSQKHGEDYDRKETSFCMSWTNSLLVDNQTTLKVFTQLVDQDFYIDLITKSSQFENIKSFFRLQLTRFWYGLYLSKDTGNRLHLINQLFQGPMILQAIEKNTDYSQSRESTNLIQGRELNIVLLAHLVGMQLMISQPDEIIASFARPQLFWSGLVNVISAELGFKEDHPYKTMSLERFLFKQYAEILSFVNHSETELNIKIRESWADRKLDNLHPEFIQDFYFLFSVKNRFRHFRTQLSEEFQADEYMHAYSVDISRNNLVGDAVGALTQIMNDQQMAKANLRVRFIDFFGNYEEGTDAGGLFKDLISELIKTLFNPAYGLMVEIEGLHELFINHTSKITFGKHDEKHYRVMGFVLAKSLQMGITLDVKLSQVLLRKLKNLPTSFPELKLYDAELFERLRALKRNPNVEALDLTFTTAESELSNKEIELVSNGSQKSVTKDNVIRYVYYLTKYKLNEQISRQFEAFLEGFRSVIDPSLLKIFSSKELQTIIFGTEDEINIDDLEANSRYENGFDKSDPYIQDFWQVVRGFKAEERKKLLKFVTNVDRAPIFGFQNLNPKFCLYQLKGDNLEELPRSATCGNVLFLHRYPTTAILRQKLLSAVTMTSGHYQH